MRIVLVSLASRGGMLHFQVELANALSRISATAVVMSSAAPIGYLEPAVETSVIRTGRGAFGSVAQAMNPGSLYRLWRGLGDRQTDLVHITGAHAWNPLVAALSRLRGKSLVYTVHDPEEHGGVPWSIRISNWITTRGADGIIVLTRHGAQQVIAAGIAARKIHVIPHGAYSLFRKWQHPRTSAGKVILYFGRFEPYKGLEALLAAFGRARKTIPGWKLLLAGSGSLPTDLLESMPPDVEVRSGYVPDEDVADLMQRASLVVVPYTAATQSGVIAIAIAFGRPVIATSVGGLSEMVTHGKTGLLVPPDDVAALAGAMQTLMRNPDLLRRMGREAARRGRAALGWDRIAAMHVEAYGEVLRERADR
jgi:glycosyltransferase involved in cell wall biosynthesis